MATNPSTLTENSGRITAPSTDYPYGSAKDDSTGTAGDGTPIKSAVMNDTYGFYQAALSAAGIVPSGNAETAVASQILQALQGTVGSFSDKSQWPTLGYGAGTQINFNAGKIADSAGKLPLEIPAQLRKLLGSAWVAGDAAGGMFTGTVAANTTYHCFLIRKTSDGTVDAGFDTDPQAFNIPTGYSAFRRIGSVVTDSSANVVRFYQQGDRFWLYAEVLDASHTDSTTPLTDALTVPGGLTNLIATLRVSGFGSIATAFTVQCSANVGPSSVAFSSGTGTADIENSIELAVDADAEIISQLAADDGEYDIYTRGWIDDRTQ